jgi:hypothetical protein
MRSILTVLLTSALLSGCAAIRGPAPAAQSAQSDLRPEKFSGGRYFVRELPDPPVRIHILELDLTRVLLETTPGDKSGGREYTARTVSAYAASRDLLAAVNGGYFTPFSGGSPGGDDYYPRAGDSVDVSGLAIAFGEVVSPVELFEDERVNAVLCVAGAIVSIEDGQSCAGPVDHALSAGPRLLSGGAPSPLAGFGDRYANTRHPRTAIGLAADGQRAWLVVADGRQPGYSDGMSLNELTALFLDLGAADALNLDGGGSSAMVLRKDGRHIVVNSPIHTAVPGRERPSANHIGVRPTN